MSNSSRNASAMSSCVAFHDNYTDQSQREVKHPWETPRYQESASPNVAGHNAACDSHNCTLTVTNSPPATRAGIGLFTGPGHSCLQQPPQRLLVFHSSQVILPAHVTAYSKLVLL